VDLVAHRKGGSPEATAVEFAGLVRSYHISEIRGDAYAARWVSDAFEKAGVSYRRSEQVRSELYLEFLPRIKSQTVELLDDPVTVSQFADLIRTPGKQHDTVDHPRNGGHDDRANVVAGAVALAFARGGIFGVLDYYHPGGGAERELEQLISGKVVSITQPTAPVSSLVCPNCGSDRLSKPQNYLCQNCGHQFGSVKLGWRGPNRRTM
jgi:hypothetical protein